LKINSASTLFFDPCEAESFNDSSAENEFHDEDAARYQNKRAKKRPQKNTENRDKFRAVSPNRGRHINSESCAESLKQANSDDLDTPSGYEGWCDTEGVKFCSRSEAVCAELLRRYVPNFELREGVTFQVAIGSDARGNTLSVDFLVDGVLFEYHPVRLFKNRRRYGDFRSKREYRSYSGICHSLKGEQRDFFQAAMRSTLARHYYAKRRGMLDQHPLYRRMELVVATDPLEFYSLILKRFGKGVPSSIERFLAIFDELLRSEL
jgi:hypothetical protein